MSKTKCLFHIVFATKRRERTLPEQHKKALYSYIFGIIKNMRCFLIRMNGIEDHIHILVDLHPTISLAQFVQEVKQSSSYWLSRNNMFPHFAGWGQGYYAVTLGVDSIPACKQYIINQELHHISHPFLEEIQLMAHANGLSFYADDLS